MQVQVIQYTTIYFLLSEYTDRYKKNMETVNRRREMKHT
jgi:hypothetical protein